MIGGRSLECRAVQQANLRKINSKEWRSPLMDGWMDGTHSGRGRRRFHFHSRNAHAMRERQGIIPVTHALGGDEGANAWMIQHFDITCARHKTMGSQLASVLSKPRSGSVFICFGVGSPRTPPRGMNQSGSNFLGVISTYARTSSNI